MSKFVESPMDYKSGPEIPKPPGRYNGDPNFPKGSPHKLPEKTYEDWPIEKGEAVGSPVIKKP